MLYGIGALLSAVSPGLGVLILGNSVLEGVGTALLITRVYVPTTLRAFSDLTSRARAFGVISRLGGLGAAAGPLIGGLITTAISWRAAFIFQAAVIALIVLLSRRIASQALPPDPTSPFDGFGAPLSAVGMFYVVFGILQADSNTVLMAVLLAAGAAFLIWFFLYTHTGQAGTQVSCCPRACSRPHIKPRADHPEHPVAAAHGGLVHRRGFPADRPRIQRHRDRRHLHRGDGRRPGLVARRGATRQAPPAEDPDHRGLRRHDGRDRAPARPGRGLVAGRRLRARPAVDRPWPRGHADPLGQPRAVQLPRRVAGGDLRAVAQCPNLGSSFGTAIAGTILVSDLASGNTSYVLAMVALAVLALIGLAAAIRLPGTRGPDRAAGGLGATPAPGTATEQG